MQQDRGYRVQTIAKYLYAFSNATVLPLSSACCVQKVLFGQKLTIAS